MWRKVQASFPGLNVIEVWSSPQNCAVKSISKDLILQHWTEWALAVRRQGGCCSRETYISLSLGERWGRKGSTQQCLKYLSDWLIWCSDQVFFVASCPMLSIRQKWHILSKGRQTLVNSFLLFCGWFVFSFFKQGGGFFPSCIILLILKILKIDAEGKRSGWFEVLSKCKLDKQSKSLSSFSCSQLSDYWKRRRQKHCLSIFIQMEGSEKKSGRIPYL